MLVHIERPSPRVDYAVRHVLERLLGLRVHHAAGAEEFRSAEGPRLSYGTERFEGALHIPWSGAIAAPAAEEPVVTLVEGRPVFFLVDGLPDLFAAIFHLLSLQDEMRCPQRDAHGRVPSTALFTVRHGLADRPWVDEQAQALGRSIASMWGLEPRAARRYAHHVTVDMDNILRYAGRPWQRALGASIRELLHGDVSAVRERWQVREGGREDPFERMHDLLHSHRRLVDRTTLFYLMRGGGGADHASDATHPATRGSIQRGAAACEIGIHPSYASSDGDHRYISEERSMLERIAGRKVDIARQHYLRWRLPDTLRHLLRSGIVEDHSLGFPDRAGFRVGTCTPFPWYDLDSEQETGLMLHPFAVMDSALVEHQHLDADGVIRAMARASDMVRAVGGHFTSVWHDRYLSGHREFAPWPAVFAAVLEHARP